MSGLWLHPDVRRDLSAIAGRGLFTSSPLSAGTVVARCEGGDDAGASFNHSCDPTIGFDGGDRLVALREVGAGEELTYDYATSTADPDFLLRCHCETYRCRGMIEGTDWRIPQLQRRYAGYWTPPLQRLIDGAASAQEVHDRDDAHHDDHRPEDQRG